MKSKYIYWGIGIVLVIVAVWWWRKRNQPHGESEKDSSSGGNNAGGGSSSSSIEQECGKISDLFSRARSDNAFASAKLGRNLSPKKCQTYLLQHILNTRGGESLVLDGIFGAKTEAAVKEHTGNKTTTLKNHL